MLIQCTKKLLDEMNVKPVTAKEEKPLFSWHANLVKVERKKAVVMMNDKNRYIVVLHGLKTEEFKQLDKHVLQAIRETFQQEGVKDEIIEKFINHSKEVIYTRTKNRSLVAKMNKACESFFYYQEELHDNESIYKSILSTKASCSLVSDGQDKYIKPNEEMYKDLEKFAGGPIFGSKAVQLKVTLDFRNYHVWRSIVVPVNMTFKKLHQVLQVVFGWKGYHLHEFYIYGDEIYDNSAFINHSAYNKEGYKPIINLVCDEDEEAFAYDNDIPMKLERGVKLSEYLPAKIKYSYDFGDNWQHYIELEKVIDDYAINYSVCLAGEGNSPPEDVGGEYGYEEFLASIADKKHPEHEDMANWGRMQGYEDFDMEMINKRLKRI